MLPISNDDISVEPYKDGERIKYSFYFKIDSSTFLTKDLYERDLDSLLDNVLLALDYKQIMTTFSCSVQDARKIKEEWKRNSYENCEDCKLKLKECYRCCIVCESPLEKKLLRELVINGLQPKLQMRISKTNEVSDYTKPVNKETILTIPDFYIEKENKKVCIYTDGMTYHNRNDWQFERDRNIDRELQNFGYTVLRFGTNEINNEIEKVLDVIKRTLSN